jgi:uncharacterized protein YbjT (DUF2867 family)
MPGSPPSDAALPAGSLVLVTGANGLVGSYVADQTVAFGYRVRGTVRDPQKSAWLTEYFDNKYGKGKFELVVVKDTAEKGAFDEAMKGMFARLFHSFDRGEVDSVNRLCRRHSYSVGHHLPSRPDCRDSHCCRHD